MKEQDLTRMDATGEGTDSRTAMDEPAGSAHSPLPWFRGVEEDILDVNGFIIAKADDDNAALILKAVNCHGDLLAALDRLWYAVRTSVDCEPGLQAQVETALTKAGWVE